jgi:hypothetical protein
MGRAARCGIAFLQETFHRTFQSQSQRVDVDSLKKISLGVW